MTTQRRMNLDVLQKIEEFALQGRSAAQIHRQLDKEDGYRGGVPTLRTVQRVVKEITPRDPSEPWSLGDNVEGEALIVPVLAELIERTDGRRRHLTRSEATWIARIRSVAPGLALWHCYMLAVAYVRVAEMKSSTEGLDALLAYAPWDGPTSAERYVHAVNDGRAPAPWPYIAALRTEDGATSDAFKDMAAEKPIKLRIQQDDFIVTYEEA